MHQEKIFETLFLHWCLGSICSLKIMYIKRSEKTWTVEHLNTSTQMSAWLDNHKLLQKYKKILQELSQVRHFHQ